MQKMKAINFFKGKYSQIKCFMAKFDFNETKNTVSHKALNLSNNNFITIIETIIKYLIIINLFCETKNMFRYCFFQNSKITLKVRGIGESAIISSFDNNIDKIYINSNEQENKTSKYFFNQSENLVEIFFKDSINLINT